MKVDNTSKAYLHYLAAAIESMPDESRPNFACFVLRTGLMKLPKLLRIIKWFLGEEKFYQRLEVVYAAKRDVLDHFYKGFLEWMVDGRDTHDPKSAGGFSQDELELMVEWMKAMGWEAD